METLWQDVKYGVRMLVKNRGVSIVAILTLALGIGANTAIFSVVYGVLFRPLPYPQPERIQQLVWRWSGGTGNLTHTHFDFLQRHQGSFAHFAASTPVGFTLRAENEAARVPGLHVSAGYFDALGVQPALGRGFQAEDDRIGAEPVAVLSHGLWQSRFGGDPGVVGRQVLVDGAPHTVIGVMPAGFATFPQREMWTPIAPVAGTVGQGGNYTVIGRLRAGVTPEQAQAELAAREQELRRQHPQGVWTRAPLALVPYRDMIASDVREPLLMLLAAIGFVLLIACANVASLLLARATARSREIAVRTALGAPRARLVRQLLTESLLLALAGGAAGLAVAYAGVDLLLAISPAGVPRLAEIRLDAWALGFALLLAGATGLLAGLAPALEASKTDLSGTLKEGAGRSGLSRGRVRLRGALVVGEVAVSLVLLAGAGLLAQSFVRLLRTDAGFDPARVLSLQLWITGTRYQSAAQVAGLYDSLVREMEALPGVEVAGVAGAGLPLERGGNIAALLEGQDPSEIFSTDFRSVTPGYFRALGLPLRQGRLLAAADAEGGVPVAVVNEAFVRWKFPGENPLGRRIQMAGALREVVGVVGDVKSYLDQPVPPTVFLPAPQTPFATTRIFDGWFPISLLVRAGVDPATLVGPVEQAVRRLDPQIPLGPVRPMEQVLSASVATRRFHMLLLGTFAGLALVLATVGIYGVLAYLVGQRTREIGIRMALGAERRHILRLVVGHGMRLALAGVGLGLVGAFYLTRLLASQLYQVQATDLSTFAGVALLLSGVALAACLVPARRASKVDPVIALRYE